MDLTILLPAYNEADVIGLLLDEIKEEVKIPHKILVMDNNSSDGTDKVALSRGIQVIFEGKRGKGIAIQTGFKYIDTPYVIMMNSDYTYPPKYVPLVYKLLKDGQDVVITYRSFIDRGAMPLVHSFGNWGLSLEASILYGRRIYDLCSGMWGFKTEVVKRFNLISEGYTLEADLFINTVRSKSKMCQVPIGYRARPGSSSPKESRKVIGGLGIGKFLLKRRFQ